MGTRVGDFMPQWNPFRWLHELSKNGPQALITSWRRKVQQYHLVVLLGEERPRYLIQELHEVPTGACGIKINLVNLDARPFQRYQMDAAALHFAAIHVLNSSVLKALKLDIHDAPCIGGESVQLRVVPDGSHAREYVITVGELNERVRKARPKQST